MGMVFSAELGCVKKPRHSHLRALSLMNLFLVQNDTVPMASASSTNIGAMVALSVSLSLSGMQAQAELMYQPLLPQFGGNNGQAFSVLQYEESQRKAEKSAREARERELERQRRAEENASSPTDRLVDTLTNQLQYKLAQGFADQILTGATSNTFDLGGTILEYTRVDGILSVTITELGSDSVTIELPVAN